MEGFHMESKLKLRFTATPLHLIGRRRGMNCRTYEKLKRKAEKISGWRLVANQSKDWRPHKKFVCAAFCTGINTEVEDDDGIWFSVLWTACKRQFQNRNSYVKVTRSFVNMGCIDTLVWDCTYYYEEREKRVREREGENYGIINTFRCECTVTMIYSR